MAWIKKRICRKDTEENFNEDRLRLSLSKLSFLVSFLPSFIN